MLIVLRTKFCIPGLNGKVCIGSVAVEMANNIGTDIQGINRSEALFGLFQAE